MRCVGGPLDNVDVEFTGPVLQIYNGPPRGTHAYVAAHGSYIHAADCCPVRTFQQWQFDTGRATPAPEPPLIPTPTFYVGGPNAPKGQ